MEWKVQQSVTLPARISSRRGSHSFLPNPVGIPSHNAKNPGGQPWVLRIVEVPGIEPGSGQSQSGLLRA